MVAEEPSEWRPRPRDFEGERNAFAANSQGNVIAHPLLTSAELERARIMDKAVSAQERGDEEALAKVAKEAKAVKEKQKAMVIDDPLMAATLVDDDPLSAGGFSDPLSSDPLSSAASISVLDPLVSAIVSGSNSSASNQASPMIAGAVHLEVDDSFEPWSAKTSGILAKYTTSEKLSITCSYLPDQGMSGVGVMKSATTSTDTVKERLEELDDEDSPVRMDDLSQSEYVKRIDQLNQELNKSWEAGQRVKALKIAIQAAKLLADMSVIKFFPSKWVLLTNVLDCFGRLVFDRIKSKAVIERPNQKPMQLPDNFTASMVPESAKEPCRNWFYKIASIRELIPRLYVEMAILKCYSFLETNDYSDGLNRLTRMIRGVGDPLAQIYMRAYLCRVGWNVAPGVRSHLMDNVDDFFVTFQQVRTRSVDQVRSQHRMDLFTYLDLFSPAIEWILQCTSYKSSPETLQKILQLYTDHCKASNVLNAIMCAFEPSYIAQHAARFSRFINEADELGSKKHHLQRTLGVNLVLCEPPEEDRQEIFKECWQVTQDVTDPVEYMACADVWIEYPAKYFGSAQVNGILGDIIQRVTPDRAFEKLYPQLLSVIQKLLIHEHDFHTLFFMDNFMPFLDLFQKESSKVEACKMVMDAFCAHSHETTADPVIVNALMFVAKQLHDSIDALSFDDERRQISHLIAYFIRKVDFGRDFEQQLNFCVEARAAFTNLDYVLVMLVHSVNGLIMTARHIVGGNHTRKTAAFVRACGAYNFITIPSIFDVPSRLRLYLICAQVLVVNLALTQADSFFKAAISTISELPQHTEIDGKMQSTEKFLVDYVHQFLGALIVAPDHPEQTQLYIFRGLLSAVGKYEWDAKGDGKARAYTEVVALCCTLAQQKYPYHITDVESNDTLYAQSKAFMNVIYDILNTVIGEIVSHMAKLGENTDSASSKRLLELCIGLVERIMTFTDVSTKRTAVMAVRLWNLAGKQPSVDGRRMKRIVQHCRLLVRECAEDHPELVRAIAAVSDKFV